MPQLCGVKILVIDIGGSHVKALATGRRVPVKLPSGPDMTPARMVRQIRTATEDWAYDVVTIGYPGPIRHGRIVLEPYNLGRGWRRFDFRRALGCPVRLINDAAMQALGSYAGGDMLFLGLGTGLGSAMIRDGVVIPMELAHLPYRDGMTYEDFLGERGLQRLGKRKWRRHVEIVVETLLAAFETDYVVLGGGNLRHLDKLPRNARAGDNLNAFTGGFRLWRTAQPRRALH